MDTTLQQRKAPVMQNYLINKLQAACPVFIAVIAFELRIRASKSFILYLHPFDIALSLWTVILEPSPVEIIF